MRLILFYRFVTKYNNEICVFTGNNINSRIRIACLYVSVIAINERFKQTVRACEAHSYQCVEFKLHLTYSKRTSLLLLRDIQRLVVCICVVP